MSIYQIWDNLTWTQLYFQCNNLLQPFYCDFSVNSHSNSLIDVGYLSICMYHYNLLPVTHLNPYNVGLIIDWLMTVLTFPLNPPIIIDDYKKSIEINRLKYQIEVNCFFQFQSVCNGLHRFHPHSCLFYSQTLFADHKTTSILHSQS